MSSTERRREGVATSWIHAAGGALRGIAPVAGRALHEAPASRGPGYCRGVRKYDWVAAPEHVLCTRGVLSAVPEAVRHLPLSRLTKR